MTARVLARLTVTREDQSKIIVEVHADATFHQFYHQYSQQGRRTSTKVETRTASRNEGLDPRNTHLQRPGLEILATRWMHNRFGNSPVVKVSVKYFAKKAYRKLIEAAPDQLGLTAVRTMLDQKSMPAPYPFSTKQVARRNFNSIHAGATR